ncbi:hypothetical protein [Ruminococcus flavefaciens]|uniref:hypothetical protein n=1 Tax=Ruminococcus flavefaciens TaxID=1265 RepID=UPI0026ED3354|nr:hypothetical protein [Ruminococcus flavefaciens]
MSKKINYSVSTGNEYELAFGTVSIAISPDMLTGLRKAYDKADKWRDKFRKVDPEKLHEAESEMRELFNEAFGTDICTPAFGDMSIFTLIPKTGKLLFEEFFNAFLPELEKDMKALKLTSRINKPVITPAAEKYLTDIPAVKPVAGLAKPYGSTALDVSGMSPEEKKAFALQLLASS